MPKTLSLPLLLLAAAAASSPGCEPPGPEASAPAPAQSDALLQAHRAWIDADFPGLTAALERVFRDPAADERVHRNALELLDRAYQEHGQRLPSSWSPPEGIADLRFTVIRKVDPERLRFRAVFSGSTRNGAEITGLRLVHHSGAVLLDKQEGVGAWSVEPESGGQYFELEGEETDQPAPEGLYDVFITLRGGELTRGWFISSGQRSSAAPVLHTPQPGQVVSTPTPAVTFDDFRSPEYRRGEGRGRGVYVVQRVRQATPPWRRAWSAWSADPTGDSVVIGGDGTPGLEDGDYWVSVTFAETRRFGPVTLRRASRTAVPFLVRASTP